MYRFKRAETEAEFEQVFRLNHAVFAGELAQYTPAPTEQLIDKFHHKNSYLIALAKGRVVGMISFHDQPPFSVAEKLAHPQLLETLGRLIEVRLLAVEPAHRRGLVMAGLMLSLYEYARDYDAIVISGYVEKSRVYRQLGFRELGPPVASGKAHFVPMMVRIADLAERQARWKRQLSAAV